MAPLPPLHLGGPLPPSGRRFSAPFPSGRARAAGFAVHNGSEELPLGTGGCATVWAATWYGRPAAAKLVSDCGADSFEVCCLANEFSIISQLRHGCIVTYWKYVFREEEATHALVLEEMAGGSLAGLLEHMHFSKLPLSAASFFDVALQMVAALTYLHDKRIVHSDIKPGNILLSHYANIDEATSSWVLPRGTAVKVGDLGIAVEVDGDGPASLGSTAGYLAPEWAVDTPPATATFARDMYALGVVLSQLMAPGDRSRRLLSSPRTASTGSAKQDMPSMPVWPAAEEGNARLFHLVNELPGAVRLVDRLLAPNPASRPTAWELQADLLEDLRLLGPPPIGVSSAPTLTAHGPWAGSSAWRLAAAIPRPSPLGDLGGSSGPFAPASDDSERVPWPCAAAGMDLGLPDPPVGPSRPTERAAPKSGAGPRAAGARLRAAAVRWAVAAVPRAARPAVASMAMAVAAAVGQSPPGGSGSVPGVAAAGRLPPGGGGLAAVRHPPATAPFRPQRGSAAPQALVLLHPTPVAAAAKTEPPLLPPGAGGRVGGSGGDGGGAGGGCPAASFTGTADLMASQLLTGDEVVPRDATP